jgi:entericidin B
LLHRGAINEEETYMVRKIVMMLVLVGFVAGCNTMSGMGRDIERGGEKLQGTAERNR